MYESPIKVYETQIEMAKENEIFKAIKKIGVTVDKDELIKALEYDRGQYNKGFEDGKEAACEWISVKDRLPTEEDANEIGSVIAILAGEGFSKAWCWDIVAEYPSDFSYWMPFPEPRKENDNV